MDLAVHLAIEGPWESLLYVMGILDADSARETYARRQIEHCVSSETSCLSHQGNDVG